MGSQSLQGYKYPFNASEVPGGVSQYSESIDYANEIYARLKLQRKRAIRMLSSDGTTGGLVDFSVVPRDSFLWDFFIPAWSACGGKLRLGDLGDGGKWICGLWGLQNRPFSISRAELLQKYVGDEIMAAPMLEEGRHPCIVYAFGVRTDVSFEVELIQATGCHVWAFDPTVGGLPAKDKERLEQLGIADKLHFEKVGVGGRNEVIEGIGRVETLSTSMDRLGHANLDILKIDVEGYEWAVLQQLVKEAETRGKDAFLRRVGMIMLEIHFRGEYEDLTKAYGVDIPELFRLIEGLEAAGLRLYSLENNWSVATRKLFPCCIEIAFVRPESIAHMSLPAALPDVDIPYTGIVYVYALVSLSWFKTIIGQWLDERSALTRGSGVRI